ncbi:MAG: M48 family metalloprotease [Nitrospiraceae bacterium]|nr:M48 family metalloprotease [Nitrospiraceae bacterium]
MRYALALTAALLTICPWMMPADLGAEAAPQQEVQKAADPLRADVVEEVLLGRETAARIAGIYGLDERPLANKYVGLVGQVVARNAGRPELSFHFGILNTDVVNSFAAPGGYIFITRGALERMQNEAELAGVLAHEVAHVAERHALRRIGVSVSADGSTGLAKRMGGTAEANQAERDRLVEKTLDILLDQGYGSADDQQADHDAILITALAGYDPAAMAQYLERLNSDKGKALELLKHTHPAGPARVSAIRETIKSESIDGSRLKTNNDRFREVFSAKQ